MSNTIFQHTIIIIVKQTELYFANYFYLPLIVFQVHAARLTSLDLDKKLGLENVIPKRAEEAIKVCDAIFGTCEYTVIFGVVPY